MAIRKDGHVIRNPTPTPEPQTPPEQKTTSPFPDIPGEPTYSEIQQAVQEALQQPEPEEEPQILPDEIEIEIVDELPQEEEPPIQPPIVYAPISETGKAFICVSDELKEHYEMIIKTRDTILTDPEASGGEQAAIINATTTALKELLKMQKEAYNADMLAKIQAAIVKSLESAPIQTKKGVLQAIKEHLDEIS